MNQEMRDMLTWVIQTVQKSGASQSAAQLTKSREVNIRYRENKPEIVKEASKQGLFLEVYSKGKLAIAAMHDINLAACYCSHVLMLFGDGEWSAGPAAEMFDGPLLERLYQCPVQMVDTPDGMRFHPRFGA